MIAAHLGIRRLARGLTWDDAPTGSAIRTSALAGIEADLTTLITLCVFRLVLATSGEGLSSAGTMLRQEEAGEV